jgi:pimeloyl-ACP methyl ester carboxylesterase
MDYMTDYILVHGGDVSTETWNSLTTGEPIYTANGRLGGRVWETITPTLKAKGHRTFTPTLINEHNCNLHGHIEQICLLITENKLNDVILVGHSYGGMIITGVASQMPDVIGKLVYLDAAIPDPGQSLFDLLEASGNDPLTGIPGLEPAMAYVDKLQFDPQIMRPIKKFFIRCTRSELAPFIHTSLKNINSDPNQWTTFELEAGHVCQPTASDELAKLLLQIDDI